MIATLRTAWAMLNVQTLLAIPLAFWVIAQMPTGVKIYEAMIPPAMAVVFGQLAVRIARVLQVGVWRLLPDGTRTAVRAIAFIVVALSLLFGSVYRWVAPAALANVPIGTILAVFTHLSLLGFLLLLGIGRQLPRFFVTLYIFVCAVSLGVTLTFLRDIPAFWIGSAALCAAAWIYGSVAGFRAPNYSRRRFSWDVSVETLVARTEGQFAITAKPAWRLLRSGRAVFSNVLVATIVFVLMALMQRSTMGRSGTVPLVMFLYVPFAGVAIFAAFHASLFGAPAKRLWLCWADSRAELFRLVERMAIKDICVVAAAACAAVIGFALMRGDEINPIGALKMLVAGVGIAITLGYVGMLFATAHAWWSRMLLFALAACCVIQVTQWWLTGFGTTHLGVTESQSPPFVLTYRIVFAMLAIVALRYAAAARWKRIDWSHYRSTRK